MFAALLKMGLGAAGGALAPSPYVGDPFEGATTTDQRKRGAGETVDYLTGLVSGQDDGVNPAAVTAATANARSDVRAGAERRRQRALERSIIGGGGYGGAEARLNEIDDQEAGSMREALAPIYGRLAMDVPNRRMQAAAGLASFINAQDAIALRDYLRLEEERANKKAFGSDLWRGIMGASNSMSGLGENPFARASRGGGDGESNYDPFGGGAQ